MYRIRVTGEGSVHDRPATRTDVPSNLLRVFGKEVCDLYHILPG
jgi:hypothetical protein